MYEVMMFWDQRRNLLGGKKKRPVPNFLGADVMYAIRSSVNGSPSIIKIIRKLQRFTQTEITMRNYTKIFGVALSSSSLSAIATIMR